MAYKQNGVTIVDDEGNWTDRSFDRYTLNQTNLEATENKITASDAAADDQFGNAVAVGNGRIVVAADHDNSNRGSVYIYDLDGTNEIKITASDAAADDQFGSAVAVGNGKIVVGSWQDDDNGFASGSAYIYDLDGSNEIKITASDGAAYDRFGLSVAVGSGKIVVSGHQNDDNGNASGSAYIYDLDGTNEIKITASDAAADEWFGIAVAAGNGKIVVGALYNDDAGSDSGSAYIYDLDGSNEIKLTASDAAAGDNFGGSVAVGCGKIVVGARYDADNGSDSGSVYVYDLIGNELAKITPSDGAAGDFFGGRVAVSNGKIVVGARLDDSNQGSVYVFDLDGSNEIKITASDSSIDDYFGSAVAVGNGKIVVGAFGNDDNGNSSGSAYIYDLPETTDIYWENIIEGFRW